MPNFLATFYFRHGNAGWSESYWNNGTDHAQVGTRALALLDARLNLMPSACKVDGVRVTAEGAVRESLHMTLSTTQKEGQYTSVSQGTQDIHLADDSLLVELIANPSRKNRKFLRGIPDEIITGGKLQTGFTDFDTIDGPTGMFGILKDPANGWQVRNKIGNPPVVSYALITNCRIVRPTSRRVGRPFAQPVGRRKRRASV